MEKDTRHALKLLALAVQQVGDMAHRNLEPTSNTHAILPEIDELNDLLGGTETKYQALVEAARVVIKDSIKQGEHPYSYEVEEYDFEKLTAAVEALK
jgi:hypothetical protein